MKEAAEDQQFEHETVVGWPKTWADAIGSFVPHTRGVKERHSSPFQASERLLYIVSQAR